LFFDAVFAKKPAKLISMNFYKFNIYLFSVLVVIIVYVFGYYVLDAVAVIDAQDALQYRENLEAGSYYYVDYKKQLWAGIVFFIYDMFPHQDPFHLIGSFIFAVFVIVFYKKAGSRFAFYLFLLLLFLPILFYNYNFVLRQGLAVSFFLVGILCRNINVGILMMSLSSLIHLFYFPFSLFVVLRRFVEKKYSLNIVRYFDYWVIGSVGVFAFLVIYFDFFSLYFYSSGEHLSVYRYIYIMALILIFLLILFRYEVSEGYYLVLVSFAFLIPVSFFANDFTRLNTALGPIILFAFNGINDNLVKIGLYCYLFFVSLYVYVH